MEEQTRKMAEAHRRMSGVALGLVSMFGPVDSAGVLFGAGIGILVEHLGETEARAYLQGLLMDWKEDGPWPGKIPEA